MNGMEFEVILNNYVLKFDYGSLERVFGNWKW